MNFLIMMVWQVGNYLIPLATFPYLTRVLGAAQFGVLGYVMAIATYGMLVTEWGFFLSGPKAVVQCRDQPKVLNELVWSTMIAKGCLCAISFAVLLVVMQLDSKLASVYSAVLAAWLMVIGNVFTLNWLLQGLERFSVFATVALAGRFSALPLTFVFVQHSSDVAIAAGIQGLVAIFTGLFSLLAARRLGVLGRPCASIRSVWQRVRGSADMFISSASVSLFGITNAVILAAMTTSYEVGVYTAADKLKTVANMVPAQINTVCYPRITALFRVQPRSAARLTVIGAVATGVTTIAGLFGMVYVSAPLTTLVLGAGYVGSASVLKLLCFGTVFGNLAYFVGLQVLVPFGRARIRSLMMLFAGVLNVVLAIVLTPLFGAEGAALSLLVAEVALLGIYVSMILSTPSLRKHFTQLLNR
ncbi:Putative O-antigen transporter [Paraburkholderia ultramafica]|uniref:O-antigen transporter n=1 Tax=Paraburkholderia ultramafica TaxID=1544867 RepID=A0A6S7AT76_9BURK|nr:flippase [Paraburkholderia ultramafica]CAB3777098.1 Putative O-antigen transporter [Paraburkholderia ultramafica]